MSRYRIKFDREVPPSPQLIRDANLLSGLLLQPWQQEVEFEAAATLGH
jgi:hypothetical protein